MQAYGPSFARVYNLRWTAFAAQVSPRIRAFYEMTPIGRENHSLLDLCCGTGQLAQHFLDHGYQVTGLDLSEAMLSYACSNNAPYIVAGLATFICGDAADFRLDEPFGLVVSTFDALNHLPNFQSLSNCFHSVYRVLEDGGLFVFDLNTLKGLQRWTGVSVNDTPEMMLVTRNLYDPQQSKAFSYISGFLPVGNGYWERFEEVAYNIGYALEDVKQALMDTGFHSVRFVRDQDFQNPIADPEQEMRIYIVTEK